MTPLAADASRPRGADGPFGPFVRPDGYEPLTERLLPASGPGRWLGIALFAVLPFVHLVTVWGLSNATGLTADGPDALASGVGTRLLNLYLTLLTLFGAREVARQLVDVRALSPDDRGPVGDGRTWLLPPLLIVLAFAVANEVGHVGTYGIDAALGHPAPFVASFLLACLIRIPQATAFWTVVVALLAIARLGHRPLPGSFPEDRSLGLGPVGSALTAILVLYAIAFVPSFLFGGARLNDLLSIVVLFVLGLGVMVLAVWRLHVRMAAARRREIDAARARFAGAYRSAEDALANATDVPTAGAELSIAQALLLGAESIYEWPFDERMQRIAAIVVTGVVTGIVIRFIMLALGM